MAGVTSSRDGHLLVEADYSGDIHGHNVSLMIEPGEALAIIYEPTIPAIFLSDR